MASKSLNFLLFGEDVTAGRAFRKLGAEAETSGKAVSGAFSGKSVLAVGAFGLALGTSVKAAVDFQSKMLLLQTQAGQSSETVKQLSVSVLKLAGATGTAPDQLATSLYHVVSTGLKGAQAMDAVKIAAEGAKVGNADLEETTNALTSAVASGIPGVQNMSQAMGELNAIVGAGDMKMQDLNEALGSGLLAVVKGFGLSLTDTGAALAVFGDNNIRGADAATALKQTVMAMAKPIAGGAKQLEALGLSAGQLGEDMAKGGLNQALVDLVAHLKASGVQGDQLGQILTNAFGRKAGPGVTILVDQLGRFQTKIGDINKAGQSFGDSWKAWTKSNQGQIDLLKGKVSEFEVQIGTKLLPVLAKSVGFVNDHSTAILTFAGALLGLKVAVAGVNLVQSVFATGQKVLASMVVQTSATVVAAEGEQAAATTTAATTQTGMLQWVGRSYESTAAKAEASAAAQAAANDSAAASSARLKLSATGAAVGIAGLSLAVVMGGRALSNYLERNNAAVKTIDGLGKQFTTLHTQLVNNGGALDADVKATVAAGLAHTGLADKAAKAGITTDALTAAVTGNKEQLGGLIEAWKASGKPSSDTIAALELQWSAYQNATTGTKTTAKGTKELTDNQKQLDAATKAAAAQILAEAKAAASLSTGLQVVNLRSMDVKGSQLSFLDSVDAVTQGIVQNGKGLDDNTAAGRSNQEALLSAIKAAQDHAVALEKAGQSSTNAGRAYLKDEDALRKAAIAAGLNTQQVDALIKKYGGLPKNVQTDIKTEDTAAKAELAAFKKEIAGLPKSIQTKVSLNGTSTAEYELELLARDRTAHINAVVIGGGGQSGIHSVGGSEAFASGTDYAPGGTALVGEQGRELVTLPKGSTVATASQTRLMNSGSDGLSLTINITSPLASKDDIARAVVPALANFYKRGGARP